MISLRNLTKSYGEKDVVGNVSLDIHKGKITSFIGPNGAGKSTILSMISRLTDLSGGEVKIDGVALKDWKSGDLAKKVSILKQTNHVGLRLTIRELVSFGRFPYCKGNLREEDLKFVEEALEYMKLEDMADRYMDEISGGQRQRAYIAMIIAQNTEYILLDEPLNNLDMKHANEIMSILRNLVRDFGKTVLIVIHDINFASCYSDRIVALKDGKVMYHDDTDKIIRSDVLQKIYNMDFSVHSLGGKRICTYYDEVPCKCEKELGVKPLKCLAR